MGVIASNEALMERMKSFFGEDVSSEAVDFMSDIVDTVSDLRSKTAAREQEELEWKKKYINRFYGAENAVSNKETGYQDTDTIHSYQTDRSGNRFRSDIQISDILIQEKEN